MAGERITGVITAAESQRENVQHLDTTISLLSHRLLYESFSQEDEIAGYRYLRSLTSHTDEIVRDAASSALDQRWKKIGFYELHTPSKRFPSFRENDRPYFREAGLTHSGSGVGDDSKVAVLKLVRRREPMTAKQFKDAMTPLKTPRLCLWLGEVFCGIILCMPKVILFIDGENFGYKEVKK